MAPMYFIACFIVILSFFPVTKANNDGGDDANKNM